MRAMGYFESVNTNIIDDVLKNQVWFIPECKYGTTMQRIMQVIIIRPVQQEASSEWHCISWAILSWRGIITLGLE